MGGRRRAWLAALCLAGPRIEELVDCRRADVDLDGGRIRLGKKTEAGLRDVELTAFLLHELRAHVAAMQTLGRLAAPSVPLLATRTGGRQNASNIRNRLLVPAVERINARRGAEGRMLLPRVTPHTLRRTFASLALAAGRDPRWVMAQLGHTDARFTLKVYAQVMQRQGQDLAVIWELMRFADEPRRHPRARGARARVDGSP